VPSLQRERDAAARPAGPPYDAEAEASADEALALASGLRAALVESAARELDELLLALLLRASGPLARGERLVLARWRRRAGGQLAWSERMALALRKMR